MRDKRYKVVSCSLLCKNEGYHQYITTGIIREVTLIKNYFFS